MATKKSVAGGIFIDGSTADFAIPKRLVEIYDGKPRVIFKKLEWYGIHPIPIDVLSPELRPLARDYEFMAIPKKMLKG